VAGATATGTPEVISTIEGQGLDRDRGEFWKMEYRHPGPLDVLLAKPDLSLRDTRPDGEPAASAICACGEIIGANYYAWRQNLTGESTTPILIEFEASEDAVAIDGRDFLYTVFQLGEPALARPALVRAFGKAVPRYAERAWVSREQSVPLCDLASHDPEVINAHHANSVVIAGRYNTIFCNAFIVRLPVEPSSIVRAWCPTERAALPVPEIRLGCLLVESHRARS
jgi:hypothetical protein